MERKGTYSIDYIFELLGDDIFKTNKENGNKKVVKELDGDLIKANSQRYQTFKKCGIRCCKCGLVASFFAKEKHENDKSYHLNLYGIDEDGNEVLFTKDHILPKSKGGMNNINNYQTMCSKCNQEKGNKIENTDDESGLNK